MGEKKREKAAEPRKRVASADAVSEREKMNKSSSRFGTSTSSRIRESSACRHALSRTVDEARRRARRRSGAVKLKSAARGKTEATDVETFTSTFDPLNRRKRRDLLKLLAATSEEVVTSNGAE